MIRGIFVGFGTSNCRGDDGWVRHVTPCVLDHSNKNENNSGVLTRRGVSWLSPVLKRRAIFSSPCRGSMDYLAMPSTPRGNSVLLSVDRPVWAFAYSGIFLRLTKSKLVSINLLPQDNSSGLCKDTAREKFRKSLHAGGRKSPPPAKPARSGAPDRESQRGYFR